MGTSTELAAVETLLMQVLPDPMGFVERIVGELAERLATEPGATRPDVVAGDVPPDELVLADRNLLLAAALGACECWGDDPRCTGCAGQGAAGWVPPDPELFATYVTPAVRRTTPTTNLAHEEPDEGEPT